MLETAWLVWINDGMIADLVVVGRWLVFSAWITAWALVWTSSAR